MRKSKPMEVSYSSKPTGPLNLYVHFIGKNPSTSFNLKSNLPTIDASTFIGPFSSVIGDVTICKNVFLACNVTIRADEGTPFFIGDNTNLQDGVILHGLKEGRVLVEDIQYSIFIGKNVTCAHGSIIHGPCKLDNNVFVGFNAIVFNAVIGKGSYISNGAIVTGGVKLASNRFVPSGILVDTQEKADKLGSVPTTQAEFAEQVQLINKEFSGAYSLMFGALRCSCGLACDPENLKNPHW
ncbi:MAG: carbonate dehydratase [Bacillota bacterium]|nr:carbonate dehydratase [Bacillota bacterium]